MIRLLKNYFEQRLLTALFFVISAGIFGFILFQYRIPAEPVFYAALLCIVPAILLSAWGFVCYVIKHKKLLLCQKSILFELESLPKASGRIEQDYEELIRILSEERRAEISKADSAQKEMREYYTLWTHQIKTPIAAMDLLLQSEEELRKPLIRAELFRIEQYAEMALTYQKLDGVITDLVFKEQSLDKVIRQVIRKYAHIFILKKITLNYTPADKIWLTDEKWLSFVIEQILSNALKYTADGEINIRTDGESLVIEDTGIGIAAEDLPRVFEKGYTGYNGRGDKKSTGIGLYLCGRIMNKLSRKIKIESEPGKGTKVTLM